MFVSAGLELDGGGRAMAGRLLAGACAAFARERELGFRLLTLNGSRLPEDEVSTVDFGGNPRDLALHLWTRQVAAVRRSAYVFDLLGLARVQAFLPGFLRAPYLVLLHGIEVWRPLEWDRRRALAGATVAAAVSAYTVERARPFCPDLSPHGDPPPGSGGSTGRGRGGCLAGRPGRARLPAHRGPHGSGRALQGARPAPGGDARILEVHPNTRLVVAGEGEDRQRLEEKAAHLGLGPSAVFTGFTSEATLAELYRRCAIFAMPSRGEGFGLVYLEAMRSAKPVLAARDTAAEEIVVDGPTGVLVDPDDRADLASALPTCSTTPTMSRRLGEAGRERWRTEFGLDRFQERLEPMLERLVELMCGINGILRLTDSAPALDREELLRTRDAMTARGPDGCGAWFSDDGRVALGSRRLAILDLSEAGAQPMASADGRYRIVLNGEIYNFRELRRSLEEKGVRFRSRSDTEVLLALYAREGTAMLSRLRGMYRAGDLGRRRKGACCWRGTRWGSSLSTLAEERGVLRFASQVKALEAAARSPGMSIRLASPDSCSGAPSPSR